MATYTYSYSGDFTSGVCISTLTDEILAEGAITINLTYILVAPAGNDDNVDIVFDSTLSGAEQTALDAVVAAHDGSVCPEPDPPNYTLESTFITHTTNSGIHFNWPAVEDLFSTVSGISGINVKVDGVDFGSGPFYILNFVNYNISTTGCWYDQDWSNVKQITIDNDLVEDNLTNFPVLIYLNADSDLAAHARSDGYDIVFTLDDCITELDYERVTYSAGTLQAWVRIPNLNASENTVINMYYGNPGASDQQNAEAAWDSNFAAVYHFANNFLDSTSNNNDGSNSGTSDISGIVGRARSFDGNNDRILLGTGSIVNPLNAFTISAWVYVDTTPPTDRQYAIYSKANDYPSESNAFTFLVGQYDTSDRYLVLATNNGSWHDHISNSQVPLTTWTYVSISYNGSDYIYYINNSPDGSGSYTSPSSNASLNQYIGDSQTSHYFDGRIDELRISSTNRSAEWLVTSFNNQNNPSAFYNISGELTEDDFVVETNYVTISCPADGMSVLTTYYEEADSESSTTSTSYQQKLRLSVSNISAGTYKLKWDAEGRNSSAAINMRLQQDDSTTHGEIRIYYQGSTDYKTFAGLKELDLSAGSYTFDLDYNQTGGGTAYIRRARILLIKIA